MRAHSILPNVHLGQTELWHRPFHPHTLLLMLLLQADLFLSLRITYNTAIRSSVGVGFWQLALRLFLWHELFAGILISREACQIRATGFDLDQVLQGLHQCPDAEPHRHFFCPSTTGKVSGSRHA